MARQAIRGRRTALEGDREGSSLRRFCACASCSEALLCPCHPAATDRPLLSSAVSSPRQSCRRSSATSGVANLLRRKYASPARWPRLSGCSKRTLAHGGQARRADSSGTPRGWWMCSVKRFLPLLLVRSVKSCHLREQARTPVGLSIRQSLPWAADMRDFPDERRIRRSICGTSSSLAVPPLTLS